MAIKRIAFGSCYNPWLNQDIWKQIASHDPDMFVFLGDTVYERDDDVEQFGVIRALQLAWDQLAASSEFSQFRQTTPILPTWDDHDYGSREGDRGFEFKQQSRALFLDFWKVPADDPRRSQDGGIYIAREFGRPDQRLQVIMLDSRYCRSRVIEASGEVLNRQRSDGYGPYVADKSADAAFLGEAQWAWLKLQLNRPAMLRLIGSSVPFSAGFRGWESWAVFPNEKRRLIELIRDTGANGVIFLSGDIHYADLSCEDEDTPYPLWDLSSSGLTHFWPAPTPNSNRMIAAPYNGRNYGLLNIDWRGQDTVITLEARAADGRPVISQALSLSQLSF